MLALLDRVEVSPFAPVWGMRTARIMPLSCIKCFVLRVLISASSGSGWLLMGYEGRNCDLALGIRVRGGVAPGHGPGIPLPFPLPLQGCVPCKDGLSVIGTDFIETVGCMAISLIVASSALTFSCL